MANAAIDTIVTRAVPTLALRQPRIIGADSFRIATDVVVSSRIAFVLDRGQTPHVTAVDMISGATLRRFVPHASSPGDTVGPVSMGLRRANVAPQLFLVDARSRRLVITPAAVHGRERLTYTSLEAVLQSSDNPFSIAFAPWGMGIAGTLTGGSRFLYSPDGIHWTRWVDTTAAVYGLPLASFMRALATSSMILLPPIANSRHLIFLPSKYDRSIDAVDLDRRTGRRIVLDSSEGAPATLRLASDGSVRIAWRNDARLHFVAAASSRPVAALLDCNCRSLGGDTTFDRRQVWLMDWHGHLMARLVSPYKISGIALPDDASALIATVQIGAWQRLVEWKLSELSQLAGASTPDTSTNLNAVQAERGR